MSNTSSGEPAGRIEIKLAQIAQLFNTMDPSPFREGDLSVEAEDYIVGRALDLPSAAPIEIVLHLSVDPAPQASAPEVARAVKDYFRLRSEAVATELKQLFKTGRLSLVVGVIVLSSCLLIGLLASRMDEGPLSEILRESFLIFGWVAIWKPSEIFLYEWPPIVRRRKLFDRLSRARVLIEVA